MTQNPNTLIVLAVVAIVVVLLIVFAVRASRRRALRNRFGAEYDRAVMERGSEGRAVAALEERQKRVARFRMVELDASQRQNFIDRWRLVQSRFVDDPAAAVTEADDAVVALMQARGYPMSDFDQRAADLSVDHPAVVTNYRNAHAIAVRNRVGQATTEDLRQAMLHYRSLFDDLLTAAPHVVSRHVA